MSFISKNKIITICGSRRFKDDIIKLSSYLKNIYECIVFVPFLNEKDVSHLDEDIQKYIFNGLTLHHFNLIDKSDIILFYNKDGYMGVSTTMELGYAVANKKLILAIYEDKNESCRNILFDKIIDVKFCLEGY